MDTLQQQLLATTFTVTAAHHRLGVLRHTLEHVFFASDTEGSVEERYKKALSELSEYDRKELLSLGTEWLDDLSQDTLHQKISALRTWLDEMPTMTLYVPVAFAEAQIETLGQWCRSEVDNSLLLEIVVEPSVVGGCAFVHNHTYHDISLRTRMAAAPNTVANILKRYESA